MEKVRYNYSVEGPSERCMLGQPSIKGGFFPLLIEIQRINIVNHVKGVRWVKGHRRRVEARSANGLTVIS